MRSCPTHAGPGFGVSFQRWVQGASTHRSVSMAEHHDHRHPGGQRRIQGKRWPVSGKGAGVADHEGPPRLCRNSSSTAPGNRRSQHRCRWMLARFHLEHALTLLCGDGANSPSRKRRWPACSSASNTRLGTVVQSSGRRECRRLVDCFAVHDFRHEFGTSRPIALCPPLSDSITAAPSAAAEHRARHL